MFLFLFFWLLIKLDFIKQFEKFSFLFHFKNTTRNFNLSNSERCWSFDRLNCTELIFFNNFPLSRRSVWVKNYNTKKEREKSLRGDIKLFLPSWWSLQSHERMKKMQNQTQVDAFCEGPFRSSRNLFAGRIFSLFGCDFFPLSLMLLFNIKTQIVLSFFPRNLASNGGRGWWWFFMGCVIIFHY